ncbi:zinc finger protein 239-like [Cydia splendana]|uniref:zinc finger protein 239-like n=1 Tax=Cydia splendana TaxID=1100963 RepID=UPI0028F48E09
MEASASVPPQVKQEPEWHSAEDEVSPSVILLPEHMRVKVEVEYEEPAPGFRSAELQRPPPLAALSDTLTTLNPQHLPAFLTSMPCPPLVPLSKPRSAPQQAGHTGATDKQTSDNTDTKTYVCDACGKTYQQKYLLIRHLQLHLKSKIDIKINRKKYDCGTCGLQFLNESELQKHKLSEGHTGLRKYPCDVCKREFSCANALNLHKMIHSGEKPFPCGICEKRFRQQNELDKHVMRMHTNERPYKCEACEKLFKTVADLRLHIRLHTGEKPFTCDICQKSFYASDSMTKHRRVHTGEKPYKCETCGMQFTNKSGLTTHRRTHTGEKPYSCDVCGRNFSQRNILVTHRRTHTGEKFSCDVCNKQFTRTSKLKVHKQKHVNEN